ncbi:MAG: CTP synthase [Thermoprotei archaeon]
MAKYIFVTGGVLSSVGKGIVTASIGLLFKLRGYNVTAIKVDPYINVDSGTMNPYAHGEVFVTDDGAETDLDLGHYERFLNINLTRKHNITTGQVYGAVIEKERRGDYLGQCVQVIPHVTDEIKHRIRDVALDSGADIVLIEIGGTVGDIEGLPFLEASRQMRLEEPESNVVFVHVALVPVLWATGEQKTKPLQHSVNELRRIGIQPDIIIGRSPKPLGQDAIKKIALFGNVPYNRVFSSYDVSIIYEVPLILESQGLGKILSTLLGLEKKDIDLSRWIKIVERFKMSQYKIKIGMVGKYVELHDAYISINEAVKHAAAFNGVQAEILWIDAEKIANKDPAAIKMLKESQGMIILPGFGARGVDGKIEAAKYARENNIPLLGICYGFQLSLVEFARNVIGLKDAHTTEVNPNTPHPIIDILPEQKQIDKLGGTMRLGAQEIRLVPNTLAYNLYGSEIIFERHRHRYEVNPEYWYMFQAHGLIFSGWSPDKRRVEFAELHDHPFYLLTQAHPEFKSRPEKPSPPYIGLIRTVIKNQGIPLNLIQA